jgi:hypothetical protein
MPDRRSLIESDPAGRGMTESQSSPPRKEHVMRKTVILSIVLALAATAPALARHHHHRPSNAPSVSRTDQGYQAPRWRDEIPFAPF